MKVYAHFHPLESYLSWHRFLNRWPFPQCLSLASFSRPIDYKYEDLFPDLSVSPTQPSLFQSHTIGIVSFTVSSDGGEWELSNLVLFQNCINDSGCRAGDFLMVFPCSLSLVIFAVMCLDVDLFEFTLFGISGASWMSWKLVFQVFHQIWGITSNILFAPFYCLSGISILLMLVRSWYH